MNPLESRQDPVHRQVRGLFNKIELTKHVLLSEHEFSELIRDIENNPIFHKLFRPKDNNLKIISRESFPATNLSGLLFGLKDELSADNSQLDVESIVDSRHNGCVPIIKKLGIDKFNKYFLYNDCAVSRDDIADECGLTVEDAKKIFDLIDDICVHGEFYFPSAINAGAGVRYQKIASIQRTGERAFSINFFSPIYLRGKYKVNYKRLAELKNVKHYGPEELKGVNNILHMLELINVRKTAIYQIIKNAVEIQSRYLCSEKESDIVLLRQKDLAVKSGMDPALICRSILRRSVVMPWGEEKPLRALFANERLIKKRLVSGVIKREGVFLTDEAVRMKLRSEFNIRLSRRSINDYRREERAGEKN